MSNYVVITPMRNEEEHLPELLASMAAQILRPLQWVLVDDGSSDSTPQLIQSAVDDHPWIVGATCKDRGFRSPGGGVVEAFDIGRASVTVDTWDFIVKLDADLAFESDYFERCLDAFETDPGLGIAGGRLSSRHPDGTIEVEKHPDFHVRGATKIYRRTCWDEIGGLVPAKGWDTIDEVKANQLGWTTRTLDVEIVQQRVTGARAGSWRNWSKNGQAAWFCGYHPLFAAARSARIATMRPYVIKGIAFAVGYGGSMLLRRPRVADKPLVAYVRREQLARLRGRPSIWR